MSLVKRASDVVVPLGENIEAGLSADKISEYVDSFEHLAREGGIVRWQAGAPDGKGGQIFAFISDVYSDQSDLAPAYRIAGASQQLGNVGQFSKLAVGLSGIGAAASIANLAVSAVGFYVLNKKVSALQEEMNHLHESVSEGFAQMEQRFVQVQYLLGDLAQGQQKLLEGQEHIQDQNEAASFAPVQTVLQRLQECQQRKQVPDTTRAGRWLDDTRSARNMFAYLIDNWCTGRVSTETLGFARAVGYYQLWAAALIAEARLLRMLGRTQEASDMIYTALDEWYFPRASLTSNILIDFELGTLLSGAFEGRINTKQYIDIQELQKGDRATPMERDEWVANADRFQRKALGGSPRERLESMRSTNARPKYSKAVQAYGLLETGRRLNTMANEYEMCARQNRSMEEWEKARIGSSSGEIRLILTS